MRYALYAAGAGLIAAVAAVVGLARYRPEVLPAWARAFASKPAVVVAEEPTAAPTLEADAPDDGWCEHSHRSAGSGCLRSLPTIRLGSAETAARVGLATARAETIRVAPKVSGNAEISYASHDYAHVTSRVAGRIHSIPIEVDEGKVVKKGAVLVVMDSAEVGTAKAQYLSLLPILQLARETNARNENLFKTEAVAGKDVLAARAELNKVEADVMKARQQLLNFGYSVAAIAEIERRKDTSNFLDVLSPMDGTLVERHAIVGEAVAPPNGLATGPMASLFDVTNLAHLWCWIDINEADVERVAPGQDVRFTISGTTAPVFSGHVELIGFAVNPVTRTVRVRAELENIDGRLRSNQYGRAAVRVGAERDAVVVPRSSVQSHAGEEFVFLPLGRGRYRTQRVEVRPAEAIDRVEVAWGLAAGQEVVTTGSFELKSELLRASIAGE